MAAVFLSHEISAYGLLGFYTRDTLTNSSVALVVGWNLYVLSPDLQPHSRLDLSSTPTESNPSRLFVFSTRQLESLPQTSRKPE
jgi:hypothetical protein